MYRYLSTPRIYIALLLHIYIINVCPDMSIWYVWNKTGRVGVIIHRESESNSMCYKYDIDITPHKNQYFYIFNQWLFLFTMTILFTAITATTTIFHPNNNIMHVPNFIYTLYFYLLFNSDQQKMKCRN
jgi:hypothetical protein